MFSAYIRDKHPTYNERSNSENAHVHLRVTRQRVQIYCSAAHDLGWGFLAQYCQVLWGLLNSKGFWFCRLCSWNVVEEVRVLKTSVAGSFSVLLGYR